MLASWSPRKADSLKRSLGQLLAREFALIKRYFSFFRRRDRSASKDSARKSARLPETLRRQRNLERADQSSGMPAPAPSTKTQKKDFREKRIKSRKSPRRKGLPTPVPPKRSVPLQREIAHSPADPFASTVGSIVFHMVLLLILIPMWSPQPTPAPDPTRMIIRYIPREDPQQEKAPEVVEVIEAPPPSEEPDEPVDHPDENEIKPVPIDQAIDSATTEDLITANATGGDFAPSRTGGGRTRALASHGGTAETESAIEAGIDWLLRHQARDGSWSPDRFDAQCSDADDHCTGSGYPEHRAGITGLCLLALLGNGHPPTSTGAPREVASWKALQWLLQHQDSTGCIRSAPGESPRNLYDHGIATFALCEAAELMDHPIIENHARKALDFIAQSQQPGGGWDYVPSPTLRNDLSITGWQVLALHAGRKLGDLPPPIVIEKLERYLLRCIDHSGSATLCRSGSGTRSRRIWNRCGRPAHPIDLGSLTPFEAKPKKRSKNYSALARS